MRSLLIHFNSFFCCSSVTAKLCFVGCEQLLRVSPLNSVTSIKQTHICISVFTLTTVALHSEIFLHPLPTIVNVAVIICNSRHANVQTYLTLNCSAVVYQQCEQDSMEFSRAAGFSWEVRQTPVSLVCIELQPAIESSIGI